MDFIQNEINYNLIILYIEYFIQYELELGKGFSMKKIIKNIISKINGTVYEGVISDEFFLFRSKNDRDIKLKVNGYAYYNQEKPIEKTNCLRYYLELDIVNPKENLMNTLVVLMLNPSNTFPEQNNKRSKVDATVKNAVRIAYKMGYAKVIIVNSFCFIDGNSNTAIKEKSLQNDLNIQILNYIFKKNRELLIAWGSKVKSNTRSNILENIKKINNGLSIYAYAWNPKGYPYHLADRVNSITNNYPLNNILFFNKKLQPLKIIKKNNKFDLILKEPTDLDA